MYTPVMKWTTFTNASERPELLASVSNNGGYRSANCDAPSWCKTVSGSRQFTMSRDDKSPGEYR